MNNDSNKGLGVVGVVPFYSQSDNLNVDSNYTYLRTMLPALVEASPKTLFVMYFPDASYGRGKWGYTPDGFNHPQIKLMKYPYDTAMRTSVLGFDPVRFSEIDLNWGITTYWMHQVEMTAEVAGGYRQAASPMSRPVLVAQQHYIIHDSLPYPVEMLIGRRLRQMAGCIAADTILYNSQHTQKMARESYSAYLNDFTLNRLDAKSQVLHFGLIPDDMPVLREYHKPVIIYNHRFEAYKRPKVTAEVLTALKTKHDFEIWVTQAGSQGTSYFPIDKTVYAPKRLDYLSNIAVPAINTINSVHETFCISILESMALGHIIVAPNSVTFPELLPSAYPYLFNSEHEQSAMLDYILTNYDTVQSQWSSVLRDHAFKTFHLNAYTQRYLKTLEFAEYEHTKDTVPKDNTIEGFNRVFDTFKPSTTYGLKDVHNTVRKVTGLGGQACPPARVIREAAHRGWSMLNMQTETGMRFDP